MKTENADKCSFAGTEVDSNSTVQDLQFSQPIAKPNVTRRFWSDEEREILRQMYPNNLSKEVAAILNRSVKSIYMQAKNDGVKKSEAFLKSAISGRANLKEKGFAYRYPKGHIPFNKDKKMSKEVYEKAKHTMFKKGSIPHNSKRTGSEVLRKDKSGKEYLMIKVSGERKLKHKHIHLWEMGNGKIIKGYNVVFKDGNSLNCCIENLECISNAELMQRNTIHRFPAELKSTIRLVKKLKRTINEKQN